MIDYSNEIFTLVATDVREKHEGTKVIGENVRTPSEFPCVTLDETRNVTVARLVDSSRAEDFAEVTYKLQVFSNKKSGKKSEARAIFATADATMIGLGFRRLTYTTTPEVYNSSIYQITATYGAIVGTDKFIYQ